MKIKIEHDKNDHIVSLYLEVDLVNDSQYARNWDIDDALKILKKEGYDFTWKDMLEAESAVNNRGPDEAKGFWSFQLTPKQKKASALKVQNEKTSAEAPTTKPRVKTKSKPESIKKPIKKPTKKPANKPTKEPSSTLDALENYKKSRKQ